MVEVKFEELVALWVLVGGLFGLFVAFAVAWVRSECRRVREVGEAECRRIREVGALECRLIREVGEKECEVARLDCEVRCLNIRLGK